MNKKNKRIMTILGLTGCILVYSLAHSCAHEENNDYKKYMTTDITYSDSDSKEEIFVTFEDIVVNKWYILEIEENNKKEIILSQKTCYDKIPNGTVSYYYKNALSGENQVYLVFYSIEEESISVETGPNIISAVSLADYLIEYELAKPYYNKDEMESILEGIKEKYNTKKDFNKDGVLVKERHYY